MKSKSHKKGLLIISCSKRKVKTSSPIKAWDLYDGVIYRVLKKNMTDFGAFDILIISAKYGLIFPDTIIENYEQVMTAKRALELKKMISDQVKPYLSGNNNIFICLGKNYMRTIESEISGNRNLVILEGGIGVKMKMLKGIINKNYKRKI